MRKFSILSLLLTCLAFGSGCSMFSWTPVHDGNQDFSVTPYRGEANAAAVVCGLTAVNPAKYNGWAGDCPGCDVDAQTFAVACRSNAVSYDLLSNSECTAANIEAKARAAVAALKPGGLLILYYSGHGGQYSDAADASETDGKSETICLWDGQLSDNIVWSLLCKVPPGIRVWMITDSCHSGTNYRGVHSYARAIYRKSEIGDRRSEIGHSTPTLLHWGGCSDANVSYGSAQGGTFTTALVDSYKKGQSYADWFKALSRRMPLTQRPTAESVGDDFQTLPAFR